MRKLEVQPLRGVGEIRFATPRDEVIRLLGPWSSSAKKNLQAFYPTDGWFSNGLQIYYSGEQPSVEYIELSSGCGLEPICFGRPVFSTPVSELIALIQGHAPFDATDPELGFSYVFPSLELSLWRPTVEDQFFSTIGVGTNGYYSR
jgi:hypothetical protein